MQGSWMRSSILLESHVETKIERLKVQIVVNMFSLSECRDQYNDFRDCIIREKKIFRSLVGNVDIKKNP